MALLVAAGMSAGCGADDGAVTMQRAAGATASETTAAPSTTAPTTSTAPAPAPTTTQVVVAATAPPPSTTAPTTTKPPIPRVVVETGYSPMAVIEGLVVLHHPANPTERIGFHQSGHDGARQMDPVETTARPFVMETRDRGTGDRTAADIVVQPGAELRAPVTGTVLRGGRYTLYCDHTDEYVVIEPDARPGWEVKVLHFEGLQVAKGQRVEAGVTRIGATARTLPFESQVDESTAEPSWPHVHVEVVDPSIPDRPTPGGGCS